MFRALLWSLCVAGGLMIFGGSALADFRMSCESTGGRYRYCAVDTRRGVELEAQKSNAPCVYQSTWGYDRSGIWVRMGCRGEFRIVTGGSSTRPPNGGDDDIIARGILRELAQQDRYDGRPYPYGRADALKLCAAYAQNYEVNRGARGIFIDSVSVDVRGKRSYAIRFQVQAEYKKKPRQRIYAAKCGVKNGEVQSYGR